MLYYLFQWLDKYDFPGAGMFGYTSFRALMAIILALLISSIWGDKFIDLLKRKQITETQRDANIDPFGVNKVGVPSMGGVIIIFAILIPCLLLGKLNTLATLPLRRILSRRSTDCERLTKTPTRRPPWRPGSTSC